MKIFLKSALVLLCLGGIILGYVHEVPYFSNTFDIQYLFFRALFLGALVGALLGWYLSRKVEDATDRVPVFMLGLVACLVILPIKAVFINHYFAKNTPLSTKALFEKEVPLRTSRFGIAKNSIVTADAFYVYFIKTVQLIGFVAELKAFTSLKKAKR